jgi:hypothetical protein
MINSFALNSSSLSQLILLSGAKSALVNLTFFWVSTSWNKEAVLVVHLAKALGITHSFASLNKRNPWMVVANNPVRGCLFIATIADPHISLFVFRRREMQKFANPAIRSRIDACVEADQPAPPKNKKE